ncbi:carbohydrate kinase family protein [Kribbella sp. NBC_01484]|uniref:carbohydrate kinase family protein n=1 Tax=Kribbella sp. NBC_01484 TaxID=2903579 RepID=UPI003FA59CA5
MSDQRPTVCLIGDANVDILLPVEEYPRIGSEALASSRATLIGGSAANSSICLARLGAHAKLIATIGTDSWGEYIASGLEEVGVDIGFLERSPDKATQLNVVVVDMHGERTMFSYRGASSETSATRGLHWLPGARALHVSGYALLAPPQSEAALQALNSASESGTHTYLDLPTVAPITAKGTVLSALPAVGTLICAPRDVRTLTDHLDLRESVRSLFARGVRRVILKRGASGTRLLEPSLDIRYRPARVQALDTTGAGDCLCAGLIAGQLFGLRPLTSLVLGSTLGALAVTRIGAGQGLPGPLDVLEHLRVTPQFTGALEEVGHELRTFLTTSEQLSPPEPAGHP